MLVRPRLRDFTVIGLYTGKVLTGVGLLMLLPLAVSLLLGEWNPAVEFGIGIGACLVLGLGFQTLCATTTELSWSHGLVVASFSWFLAMVLGAIPHWLSGHFSSFLDAMFDLMSGYTTTGLILIQDLDHVSHGLNMWRHLLTYAGGQGIVVLALAFLSRGAAGAYTIYVGEGKDERLLPNVLGTARAIWFVSLAYLGVGTCALWAASIALGQAPVRGLLHSLWVFMGAWSTGGFAPMSYNTLYYHSLPYELICAVLMVAGSLNFALHWAVWTGDRREMRRNIEVQSFFLTMTMVMLATVTGLMRAGVYPDALALFRKMFYQAVSGHTTTGFSTIYAKAFLTQWGTVPMMAVALAMAIGASACSTGGGFKGLRIGVIFSALAQDAQGIISPQSAQVVREWHHIKTRILEDATVRSAMFIVLSYVGIYSLGAFAGILYGYDLPSALFESVSAGSNSGLSCALTNPAMPSLLKAVYILEMWAGRLEFVSLFALGGYLLAFLRGK